MKISRENNQLKTDIARFDKRIEEMHMDFYKYYNGIEKKLPDMEGLERELLSYSRKKIFDREISNNLDRAMYKFQNRKKIWLTWVDEFHHNINNMKK